MWRQMDTPRPRPLRHHYDEFSARRLLAALGPSARKAVRTLRPAGVLLAPPGSPLRLRASGLARRLGRWAGWMASEDGRTLGFAEVEDPRVSIVIPVHGQWELTSGCLSAIAADRPETSYEVIVVDDASPDQTPGRLEEVHGLRWLRLEDNVGFLGAVNAGLELVQGSLVVLLNNDTVVQRGWLDALVDAASDPQVAVVGAKLVYPDGTLQEAGGVIWRDGSGYNVGRGENPTEQMYDFIREVDYCSGACLLVRRELLTRLGGLDSRFSPAYYEDTDLCFSARALGYRVLYQPASVICHLEGASHGTDVAVGIKRYQEVNRERFCAKWADSLEQQWPPDLAALRLASWRSARGRFLVVDHSIPKPDHDSGSRRMFEMLQILSSLGFGVTFCPQDSAPASRYTQQLLSLGIEVLGGPADLPRYLKEVGLALKAVVLSRPTVAWANYLLLRSLVPDAVLIYDTVDLHYVREERRAAFEATPDSVRSSRYHREVELTLARLLDTTWVVTGSEAATLRAEFPDLVVSVVPNIHPLEPEGPPFDRRAGLLFVGSFPHHPNRDAAKWLVHEIFPLVRREIPAVTLYLAGSEPDDEIRSLGGDGVEVLGWVADLADLYRRTRLMVAPLRFGAGMNGKVGESLAYGLPVVTTPQGADGMDLVDGRDAMVGRDAAGLARAVVRVYEDQMLWERLATEGRAAIARRYAPEPSRANLARILCALGLEVGCEGDDDPANRPQPAVTRARVASSGSDEPGVD